MEYVILDIHPVIDGVTYSNFININAVFGDTANVQISNASMQVYDVKIVNNDIEKSVNQFFNQISDKGQL